MLVKHLEISLGPVRSWVDGIGCDSPSDHIIGPEQLGLRHRVGFVVQLGNEQDAFVIVRKRWRFTVLLFDNERSGCRYCLESDMGMVEMCSSLTDVRPDFIVEVFSRLCVGSVVSLLPFWPLNELTLMGH